MKSSVSSGPFFRLGGLALFLPCLLAAGCGVLRDYRAPSTEVKSLQQTGVQKPGEISASALQSEVMRFADHYAGAVAQAADDFVAVTQQDEARAAAFSWKIGQASAAFVNAANPNPLINALDMVVLATLSRMVQEDHWVGKAFGESARPLLQTHQQLEREAWEIASKFLKPEQQRELRELAAAWRARNPDLRYVASTRLAVFAEAIGKLPEEGKARPGSIFSLFMVDPLAGLDPAARALEQTRYLAERSMYYFQRLPTLLSWQAELLTFRITAAPDSQKLLADIERLSKSAEAFGRAADQLPKLVDDQRQAALDQLFTGIATERTNILAALAAEQAGLSRSLAELRQTLEAGTAMAGSLDSAVQSLDKFVGGFKKPPGQVPATNSRPFDVLDYGRAASEIAGAARELNTVIGSLDQSLPRVQQASANAERAAERLLHRGFLLAALLIVLLLVGALTAGVLYRKWSRKGPPIG